MIPLEFITGVLAPRSAEKISLDPEPAPSLDRLARIQRDRHRDPRRQGRHARRSHAHRRAPLPHRQRDPRNPPPQDLRGKARSARIHPARGEGAPQPGESRADGARRVPLLRREEDRPALPRRVRDGGAPEGAAGEGDAPKKLVLFLERGKLPEIPEVDFAGKKMVEMLDEGAKRKIIEPVRTIAIDPGHGGPDIGKIEPLGRQGEGPESPDRAHAQGPPRGGARRRRRDDENRGRARSVRPARRDGERRGRPALHQHSLQRLVHERRGRVRGHFPRARPDGGRGAARPRRERVRRVRESGSRRTTEATTSISFSGTWSRTNISTRAAISPR